MSSDAASFCSRDLAPLQIEGLCKGPFSIEDCTCIYMHADTCIQMCIHIGQAEQYECKSVFPSVRTYSCIRMYVRTYLPACVRTYVQPRAHKQTHIYM